MKDPLEQLLEECENMPAAGVPGEYYPTRELVERAREHYEQMREELKRETARADVNDWIRANRDKV